jgi:hypothetical protein
MDVGIGAAFSVSLASTGVPPDTFYWRFGSGNVSTGPTAAWTATSPGNYTYSAWVIDGDGVVDSEQSSVVAHPAVKTGFAVAAHGRGPMAPVALSATVLGGTPPYAISWRLDNRTIGGAGMNVTLTLSPGTYQVGETASDSLGSSAIASLVIVVHNIAIPDPAGSFGSPSPEPKVLFGVVMVGLLLVAAVWIAQSRPPIPPKARTR